MSRDASELVDRLVAGERLSDAEARLLEEAARVDPAQARELELLDELADAVEGEGAPPSAAAIAIAQAALARVAAGEVAPIVRPRRARWIVPIVAAALAAAAAVVLSWGGPTDVRVPAEIRPLQAQLVIASGEVVIDGRAIGDALPSLADATTIAVQRGRVCIAIDPRIDVCLDDATTASIAGLAAAQTSVELRRGHAIARLDPLPDGRSFALASAELRAVAVGTMFSLDVDEDTGTVTAAVLQGTIEVATADTIVRLGASELVRVSAGGLVRDRLSAAEERRELELIATMPEPGDAIGHVAIEVSPPATLVLVDDRPLGPSPLVAALPAGAHRLELRGADGARLAETVTIGAGTLVARRFTLAGSEPVVVEPVEDTTITIDDDEPQPGARPRTPSSSPRELLAQARTLRREDRWADAVAAYRRLVREHPRSSEAHTALVSIGDLLLDRLAQPDQAARAYQRYVRDGGGALAPEARWGIIRARRKQGDGRAERAAIDDFLRHHPDDARADSLR